MIVAVKVNYNCRPHKTIICVPYGFIMRIKYFAGNFSACIITNNEFWTCKKHFLKLGRLQTNLRIGISLYHG